MKICHCTDPNCGCSLSDKLTVGNINTVQYPTHTVLPNTFYIENKPLTIKYLSQYTVDELINELKGRNNVFMQDISYDENSQIYMVIKK